jgi:DNA-binding LytR/AlgR family response regulator
MINCIAIDDEPLALDLMEEFASRVPFLNLIGKFTNAFDAIAFLSREEIDLVFSDIEMPDISGIQLVSSMKNRPLVIFVTAHGKYAIDGFKLDVVDYLLKPVDFDLFMKAVTKADEMIGLRHHKSEPTFQLSNKNYIFVKSDYKIVKVYLDDILFFEGLKDYVKIHTSSGTPVLSLLSLKNIEEKMPADRFIRVHRSYIVSIDKIESIEKKRIKIGNKLIPISDSYDGAFFKAINLMNL